MSFPPIQPLPYPITDPAERRSAYLSHRSYIDTCFSLYSSHYSVRNATDYIEVLALQRFPSRPALEAVGSEELRARPITYQQMDRMASRLAGSWIHAGLSSSPTSPVVALLMDNCPFFLLTWLSLAKIGVTVPLVNTALRPNQLRHALQIASASTIIVAERYRGLWEETVKLYEAEGVELPRVYWSRSSDIRFTPILYPEEDEATSSDSSDASSSATAVPASPSSPSSTSPVYIESALSDPAFASYESGFDFRSLRTRRRIGFESPLFYIYTSGTTGPSKAAIFSHRRFIGAGLTWSYAMDLTEEDKYLILLPLFHGNGGVMGVSACMHAGGTMVIREKFSTSNFWKDVKMHSCTAMVYVGELWRYLHNASRTWQQQNPGQPLPVVNETMRVACGNGLRSDIWSDVCSRFNLKKIVEHYGMTEMPAGPYINFYGQVGSCGFIPPEIRAEQGADKLVAFDVENNEVVREVNADSIAAGLPQGSCVEVTEAEQVGEALFLLAPGIATGKDNRANPHTEGGAVDADSDLADPLGNPLYKPYRNYTDVAACERRVYRHVFQFGDAWFATGDLLKRDSEGFFYFVDRIGDTFRFKGENVATNEVAEVMCAHPNVEEANVYGVEWRGQDGRAGMASILWKETAAMPMPSPEAIDETSAEEVLASLPAQAPLTANTTSLPSSFSTPAIPASALSSLLHHLLDHLPPYAVPAFIRIRAQENNKTSTLKFQKFLYQREGFDPSVVSDQLFWWPGSKLGKQQVRQLIQEVGAHTQEYVPITAEVYKQIIGEE